MAKVDVKKAVVAAQDMVREAISNGKLQHLTNRIIRQDVEQLMELEPGTLEEDEHRKQLNKAIKAAIEDGTKDDAEEEKNPKKQSASKEKEKSNGNDDSRSKDARRKSRDASPSQKRKSGGPSEGKEVKKPKPISKNAESRNSKPAAGESKPAKKALRKAAESKDIIDGETDQDESHSSAVVSKARVIKKSDAPTKGKKRRVDSEAEEDETEASSPPKKVKKAKASDSPASKSTKTKPESSSSANVKSAPESKNPNRQKKKPTTNKEVNVTEPSGEERMPDFVPLEASSRATVPTAVVDSDSELSSLIDDGPPVKKTKGKGKAKDIGKKPKAETKEKKARPKKEGKELSADEEQIKKLKGLVFACGVRKVWARELKDCEAPSSQIAHIRRVLTDLGMKGRFSLEQAKAIRAKRELEQELAEVNEFAAKHAGEGRPKRASTGGAKKQNKSVNDSEHEEDSSDAEEYDAPRKKNARQSIMAFLGDQSESD